MLPSPTDGACNGLIIMCHMHATAWISFIAFAQRKQPACARRVTVP
jgi:hypothetical protein